MTTGQVLSGPPRTLGVDLASQPHETGVCLVEWSDDGPEVIDENWGPLTDDALIALMGDPQVVKVGIDAPFGWPLAFIDAVTTYRDDGRWLDLDANEMRFRATENRIYEETRQRPLSVAVSDLAWPAMRCARLLSRLADSGMGLDRSGATGIAVEVYPMAALRRWDVVAAGSASSTWSYKGDNPGRRDRRATYLKALQGGLATAVGMSAAYSERCVDDDDDFDAFVCALVARAANLGFTDPVPDGMRWLAMREGWIHVPTVDSLDKLGAD